MTKGVVKGGQGFQRGGRVKDFKGVQWFQGGSKVPEGGQGFQRGGEGKAREKGGIVSKAYHTPSQICVKIITKSS